MLASSTSGEWGSSSESSTGLAVPFDGEAFAAMCAAIESQGECDAVPTVEVHASEHHWCTWETWVVVTFENDVCTFAAVQGSCAAEAFYSEGCGGHNDCGPSLGGGAWRMNERGQIEVGNATSWCVPNGSFCELQNPETPPECTCFCDPAWPGIPL